VLYEEAIVVEIYYYGHLFRAATVSHTVCAFTVLSLLDCVE
jgi:hypothetical protein